MFLVLPAGFFLAGCSTLPWFKPKPVPVVMTDPAPPPPVEVLTSDLTQPALTTQPEPAPRRQANAARPPVRLRGGISPTAPPPPKPEPEIKPAELVGLEFAGVLKVLRKPDTVHDAVLPVVWSYAEADCTLQLYFYPDIQTTRFHLLKYDLKEAAKQEASGTSGCMRRFAVTGSDAKLAQ